MGKVIRYIGTRIGIGLVWTVITISGAIAINHFFIEPRHEARRIVEHSKKTNLSVEVLNEYRKLDINLDWIDHFSRRNVTPEIVKQLRAKERLTPYNVFWLVVAGNLEDITHRLKGSWFDGEEYQKWVSKGLSLKHMAASFERGITLDRAIAGMEAGFHPTNFGYDADGYLKLVDHRIGLEDAKKLAAQGNSIDDIVKKYANAVGVKPEERRDYLELGFKDPEIKLLAINAVTPSIAYSVMRSAKIENPRVIELVNKGKLSGEIYQQWAEFFSDENIGFAIVRGYSLETAKDWRRAGFDIRGMDTLNRGYKLTLVETQEWVAKGYRTTEEIVKALEGHRLATKHYKR